MDDSEPVAVDTMPDLPSHPLPLASPPSSTTSLLFAQEPFHSAPAPHHQQTNQSHQISYHTDSHQLTPYAMLSESTSRPLKRARLDSTQDASARWGYSTKKSKPIGIALPQVLQKVETHECEMYQMLKVEEPTEVKSSHMSVEGKEEREGKRKDKMKTFSLSASSCDEKSMQVKKPCLGNDASVESSSKECSIFISHSTTDRDWAEGYMMARLSTKWRVKASYHELSDHQQYDNAQILECMKQSLVVIIGISPAYTQSQRCIKEWKYAVHLSCQQPGVCVVVAGVVEASRPAPLKRFLHLDFINKDREKRNRVWDMLYSVISKSIRKPLEQVDRAAEGSHQQHDHHQHWQHRNSNCPSRESQSSMDMDSFREAETTGMMNAVAEFEQIWTEGGGGDVKAQEEERNSEVDRFVAGDVDDNVPGGGGGPRDCGNDGRERGDLCFDNFSPSASGFDHSEPSIPWSVVAECGEPRVDARGGGEAEERREGEERVREEEGQEVEEAKVKVSRGRTGDVEEGEVSDSSEENRNERCEKRRLVPPEEEQTQSGAVASFYDNLARPDVDKRDLSPIRLMRNFNNWVKSILLRTYLALCPTRSVALDICCGKGGDLLKWKEGRICHLVCADISGESIAAAKERYHSDKMVGGRRREPPFTAEFFEADCCKDRLIERASSPWFFHIASCQFSIHYSFESYDKAHMMLRNACENLRPGGYFVGTTIDANQLIHRLRKKGPNAAGVWSVGNKIFTVTLDSSLDIYNLPIFGACYNFKLHGVVDLPEYLVHFPLLVKILEDFGMDLVLRQNFYHFFEEHKHIPDDRYLLFRMSALDRSKGTMSRDEWEAVGLYLVYVFQKKKEGN